MIGSIGSARELGHLPYYTTPVNNICCAAMSRGDWRWIRTEATQRGLSLPQLASYLDVTPQAVNYWVNNRNDPDFLNLLKLAYIFCDGSLEKLAHKAGIDLRALRQDLRLQAEALGIEPPLSITNGPVEPLLLPPPGD